MVVYIMIDVALISGFWDGQEILVHSSLFRRRFTKDASSTRSRVSIETRLRFPVIQKANIYTYHDVTKLMQTSVPSTFAL